MKRWIGTTALSLALHVGLYVALVARGRAWPTSVPHAIVDLRVVAAPPRPMVPDRAPRWRHHRTVVRVHDDGDKLVSISDKLPQRSQVKDVPVTTAASALRALSGHDGTDRPAGAAATISASAAPAANDTANLAAIRTLLQSRTREAYPLRARRLRLQGLAVVRFRVGGDGQAIDITVASSAGVSVLDEAALDIVRTAGPYPVVHGLLSVPIRFALDE